MAGTRNDRIVYGDYGDYLGELYMYIRIISVTVERYRGSCLFLAECNV